MRQLMQSWLRTERWLAVFILLMIGFSVALLVLSFIFGLAYFESDDVRGYCEKWNWCLFPLWWIIAAALVHVTWHPFRFAWDDLCEQEIIHRPDEHPAGRRVEPTLIEQTFCQPRTRLRAFILSAIVASLLTIGDKGYLWTLYLDHDVAAPLAKDIDEVTDPEPFPTQLLDDLAEELREHGLTVIIAGEERPPTRSELDHIREDDEKLYDRLTEDLKWSFACFLNENRRPSKIENGVFLILAYVQQIGLGTLGLLALLQVSIHCFGFWFLERLPVANGEHLKLTLNGGSHLHEFGLEQWNHALNNVYWVFALAMMIPIASRSAQPAGQLDTGQVVLRILVPILIALPMIATVVGRQQYVCRLWDQVRCGSSEESELYHKQRLWPLDKNWVSKLGALITFALLSFFLGAAVLSVL